MQIFTENFASTFSQLLSKDARILRDKAHEFKAKGALDRNTEW